MKLPWLLCALFLSGCAALNSVSVDVVRYSEWPAGLSAGSIRFERLPSQRAQPHAQQALEAAALQALQAQGFRVVADGAASDFSVQIGARVTRVDASPWDDPFWWSANRRPLWRHAPLQRPPRALRHEPPTYLREVALLIRDARSGTPLVESHASSEGLSEPDSRLLAALFDAALRDYRVSAAPEPRRLRVPLP